MYLCMYSYLVRLFDFEAVQKNLKEKSALLTNIPYKSMQQLLFAKSVITPDEKQHLDKMINSEQISVLIDILLVSLKLKITKKYKGFLQSMEESGDLTLEKTAKDLGE